MESDVARPAIQSLMRGKSQRNLVSVTGLPREFDETLLLAAMRQASNGGDVRSIVYTSDTTATIQYATVRAAYTAFDTGVLLLDTRLGIIWPTNTSFPIQYPIPGLPEPPEYNGGTKCDWYVACDAGLLFVLDHDDGMTVLMFKAAMEMLAYIDKQTGHNSALVAVAIMSSYIDTSTVDLVNDYPEVDAVMTMERRPAIFSWHVKHIDGMPPRMVRAHAVLFIEGQLPTK